MSFKMAKSKTCPPTHAENYISLINMSRRLCYSRQKAFWRGGNMKYFLIIFLLCAVQPLRGSVHYANRTNLLASVKEYPSFLHKCTATFIKKDVLITTAHCIFCERYCILLVEPRTNHLSNRFSGSKFFYVENTVIHPEYEPFRQQNDVGLIKLRERVIEADVFDLPTKYFELRGVEANTFEWKFSENGKAFMQRYIPSVGVSNAMCSLALNQYVGYPYVCAMGRRMYSFGTFDNGTPLVGKFHNVWLLLGLYVRQGIHREVKIEIFQSVIPYLGWISQVLRKNFHVTPADYEDSFMSALNNAPLPTSQLNNNFPIISLNDGRGNENITDKQIKSDPLNLNNENSVLKNSVLKNPSITDTPEEFPNSPSATNVHPELSQNVTPASNLQQEYQPSSPGSISSHAEDTSFQNSTQKEMPIWTKKNVNSNQQTENSTNSEIPNNQSA